MTEMRVVPKCPQCGRALAAVPFMQCATEVVRRKCQKCKSHWHMVVKPVKRGEVNVTVVDFVAM